MTFLAFLAAWLSSDLSVAEGFALLRASLLSFSIAELMLFYILFYMLRSVVLIPGTIVTVVTGNLLGPLPGLAISMTGGLASSVIAFTLARRAGREFVEEQETPFARRWDARLRKNGFVTVMVMRLIYLPYDAVNVGCGLSSIRLRDFAAGTFVGLLPSTLSFVLLGTTAGHVGRMVRVLGWEVSSRMLILVLSVLILSAGFALASMLHRREQRKETP